MAANGGSSSLFGSPLDSDWWCAVEGLFVLLFTFTAEGTLGTTVSGGRDFVMRTVMQFFVETISTMEREREGCRVEAMHPSPFCFGRCTN